MAVTGRAKEMIAEGVDVVSMSAGEPDFDTPEHIKQAAIEALNEGKTKYTPVAGIPQLRQAVADKFERENGIPYAPEQTLITIGGKYACYLACEVLLDPGDEAIIPAPYWVSYPSQAELVGGRAIVVETGDDLKMTPEQLEAAITPRSKLLVLNSPSNPSGVVYTKEALLALAEVVAKTDIVILSDEIYEHLVYDGGEHHSWASIAPELIGRTITANGVAKSYSMTGWRIGYAAGPLEIIKAMSKVQSQQTSNATSIAQWATVAALNGPQDEVVRMRTAFAERRDHIVNRLNAIDGVSCPMPGGAFYVFPDVSAHYGKRAGEKVISDSIDLCNYLLEEHLVATVPGSGFGKDRHLRISYACSVEQIDQGIDRVAQGLAALN